MTAIRTGRRKKYLGSLKNTDSKACGSVSQSLLLTDRMLQKVGSMRASTWLTSCVPLGPFPGCRAVFTTWQLSSWWYSCIENWRVPGTAGAGLASGFHLHCLSPLGLLEAVPGYSPLSCFLTPDDAAHSADTHSHAAFSIERCGY